MRASSLYPLSPSPLRSFQADFSALRFFITRQFRQPPSQSASLLKPSSGPSTLSTRLFTPPSPAPPPLILLPSSRRPSWEASLPPSRTSRHGWWGGQVGISRGRLLEGKSFSPRCSFLATDADKFPHVLSLQMFCSFISLLINFFAFLAS
jgi:hypothetical protein